MKITKEGVTKVLGIAGAGIISSAAWEVSKPLFSKGWDIALTVVTLGIGSLKDSLYAQARFSVEVTLNQTILLVVLLGPLFVLTALQAIGLNTWTMHNGNLRFRKQAKRMGIFLNVGVIFGVIQVFQDSYIISLAGCRAELETIAAVGSADQELRPRAAELVQVRSRKEFILYVEGCRSSIQKTGRQAPSRDFF